MRAASSEKQPLETVLENVLGISPSVFFSSPGQPCLSVLSYIDSVLLFLNCDFSGSEDNRFCPFGGDLLVYGSEKIDCSRFSLSLWFSTLMRELSAKNV